MRTGRQQFRGLLIVSQLADRWAVLAHPPTHPGKTVRAEVDTRPTGGTATSATGQQGTRSDLSRERLDVTARSGQARVP